MSARIRAGAIPALMAVAALALSGCGDDGPSGPGTLDGEVTSAQVLGAVVLRVEGTGIDAIEGAGGTRAFVGPVTQESRRVVLVGDGVADLRFEVDVQDVGASRPTATVESAVDASNRNVPGLSGVGVRISLR